MNKRPSHIPRDASEISRALARLDVLAPQIVMHATPVRFALAQSAAERETVFRMRYRVVLEKGWGGAAGFPDGLERDAHDERAIHVVGWDGDTIAASGRIVLPTAESVLPTEEAFGLVIEPRGQVVDWGRTIVATRYRSISHRVLAGLVGKSWIETRRRGFCNICAIFTQGMTRLYRRMGLHFIPLCPPQRYWNEKRIAVRIDIVSTAQALTHRSAIEQPSAEAT